MRYWRDLKWKVSGNIPLPKMGMEFNAETSTCQDWQDQVDEETKVECRNKIINSELRKVESRVVLIDSQHTSKYL